MNSPYWWLLVSATGQANLGVLLRDNLILKLTMFVKHGQGQKGLKGWVEGQSRLFGLTRM